MSSSHLMIALVLFVSVSVVLADDDFANLPIPNNSPQSGYYQYVNVPSPFEYEFGFNVGNKDHYISRFEQVKNSLFRTMVKWSDSDEGYGQHVFEYNHGDSEEPSYEDNYRKPKKVNSAVYTTTTAVPYVQRDQQQPQRQPLINNEDYPVLSAYGGIPVRQRSISTTPAVPLIKVITTPAPSKLSIQPKFTGPSYIKYEPKLEVQSPKRFNTRVPSFRVDNNP